MSKEREQFNKYVALFLIITLGVIIYLALRGFLAMFLATFIIFTLFKPMQKWLVLKKKWSRTLASLTTMVTSVIILVIPVALTIGVVGSAVSSLVQNNSNEIESFLKGLPNFFQNQSQFLQYRLFSDFTLQNALDTININYSAVFATITSFVQRLATDFTTGISSFFFQAIIMYFILFFIFRDWDKFAATIYRYSPFNTINTKKLIKEFDNMTLSNIVGSGAVAISQGIAVWLGFIIFQVPQPLFWGFITVVVSFLPLFGAPLIWIPTVIILFAQKDYGHAIGFLVYSLTIISWIDNFVRPTITSRVGKIHPLISIIGIFLGIPMFGVMGIILGPALLAFFIITIEMYYQEFLHEAPMNPNTPNEVIVQKTSLKKSHQ